MFDLKIPVLIVDDMSTMRKLVKKAVKGIGFETVDEASGGHEAWEKLNENSSYGLIISDWTMPSGDGLEFLKRVRSSDKFKEMPFLLLTAESEADQVKQAIAAGVSNYIVKPFTAESLAEKLEAAHQKLAKAG